MDDICPVTSTILEAVADQLPSAVLPGDWQWLPVATDCRRGTCAPEPFFRLFCDFNRDDVLASHLATENESGELCVWPPLIGSDSLILLRNREGRLFDIVSPTGCVSGRVPLFCMRQDAEVQSKIRESPVQLLLAAPRFDDVVILRSLGVAASPAMLLDRLNISGLKQLSELVRFYEDVEPESEADSQAELLLVAGSITDLSREPQAEVFSVTRHLAGAQHHIQLGFDNLGVWWPTPEEVDGLRYIARLRDVRSLREKLQNPTSSYPVDKFIDPRNLSRTPNAAEKLFSAHDKLATCLRSRSSDRRRQYEAATAYVTVIREQLFQPLITESFESSDILAKNVRLLLANSFLAAHLAAPNLQALLVQRLSDPHDAQHWDHIIQQSLKETSALTTVVEKLLREQSRQNERALGWWSRNGQRSTLFRAN